MLVEFPKSAARRQDVSEVWGDVSKCAEWFWESARGVCAFPCRVVNVFSFCVWNFTNSSLAKLTSRNHDMDKILVRNLCAFL